MSHRHTLLIITILLLAAGLCATANAQNGNGNGNGFDRIPNRFQSQLGALGNRGKKDGKQKTVYTGRLFIKGGESKSVRIIHQLPNLVRLEGFKSGNAHISFDGERAYGVASRKEESYLETFVMDTIEGMLSAMQSAAAIRFLGSNFGPDPAKFPDYTGPRFDIIDVTDTVRCKREKVLQPKLYFVNSGTGILYSTRYTDRSLNPAVRKETHFSVWGTIDGSSYPARIDHYENGELEFTFIAEEITAEPSTDIEDFR